MSDVLMELHKAYSGGHTYVNPNSVVSFESVLIDLGVEGTRLTYIGGQKEDVSESLDVVKNKMEVALRKF